MTSTTDQDRSWYFRVRQEWISEMISIYGFINREHLQRKFGISTPQASLDLKHFQQQHPKAMQYNHQARRYEGKN